MAKIPHEALHRIFREDPGLFTRTLRRVLTVDFPEIERVSVLDTELTTTTVLERRVDTILKAETTAGSHLLVIEPLQRSFAALEPARSRYRKSVPTARHRARHA